MIPAKAHLKPISRRGSLPLPVSTPPRPFFKCCRKEVMPSMQNVVFGLASQPNLLSCYATHTHYATNYRLSEVSFRADLPLKGHFLAYLSPSRSSRHTHTHFSFFVGGCHSRIRRPKHATESNGITSTEGPRPEALGVCRRVNTYRGGDSLRQQTGRSHLSHSQDPANGASFRCVQRPVAYTVHQDWDIQPRSLAEALGALLVEVSGESPEGER